MADAPLNIEALRADLKKAIDGIAERTPDYIEAREYYDGTMAEKADSRAARAIIRQSKLTPLSFAHIPVDVIVEKVELASITAKGSSGKKALETWIDANDIPDEAVDWIQKAGYFGDYYVVTDPVGLEDDGTVAIDAVDSVGMSPLTTIRIYDSKTRRHPEFGAHFWDTKRAGRDVTKALIYYDDATVKLIAFGKTPVTDPDDFELDVPIEVNGRAGEDVDAYIDHDGGRMLIHHLAIGGKPYGIPLHSKAYGPQDAITKVSANNLVNVDALGLPSRWALIDPNAEIDDDIDDDFSDDGPSTPAAERSSMTDATTGRRIRTMPGAIEYLRGVSQTGTYEAAQADPFLANIEFYLRAMGVACGIPLFELDTNGAQPSGEARRRAESRANRTARRIQREATGFFTEIADTVLGLVGITDAVAVTFTPTETATDKDGLELVSSKVKAGVPLRQALLEAGYTDEQVNAWYPPNAPAISPDLMTVIAAVLAALGSAKTLGTITDEGIEAMIPDLFGYATLVDDMPEGVPVEDDGPLPGVVTDPATQMKNAADALGVLIRAGVDQTEAAERVGLAGLSFPNLPTTIRVPETDAVGIEQA